ncbi:MAG: hypothetical protein ACREQ5_05930 [Candidatus Dormibacteria bacterium]
MIKASGRTGDGDALVLLGLSRENTTRLLDGQPIKVHGQDVGMPGVVIVLLGGETEDDIKTELTSNGLMDDRTWQVGS